MSATTVVFVGGGPRVVSLLERLAANLESTHTDVHLHVVDPHPAGGGRIWRREQSELLWMNSRARDVTIFTDESVTCDGPVVRGPALDEWIRREQPEVENVVGPDDFAPRQVQADYLRWAWDRIVASLPPAVTVTEHRENALRVTDLDDGRQQVELAGGAVLTAEVVVLAQGYLDRTPTPSQQELSDRAQALGLDYVLPGYTADVDLSDLRAGEPVLVRGFGLAFIDLMVLVNQGRGGTFTGSGSGLTYHPSGAEPVLWVGSRRGVPYHAKLGYQGASGPVPPRYFTLEWLGRSSRVLDYRSEIWPVIVKELAHAHYRELFTRHPDRVTVGWEDFRALLDVHDVRSPAFLHLAATVVPDPADRFDIAEIDRPLADLVSPDQHDAETAVRMTIEADLARRADPRYSSDSAVFDALLGVYGVLVPALVTGRIDAVDRVQAIEGEFHGLFSFLASGPPPQRLAELLAVHRAGLVRFLGPGMSVEIDETSGRFAGRSSAHPEVVSSRVLVDAYLPRPDVRAATDPIIQGLLQAGELAAEDLLDRTGRPLGGGQLLADELCRSLRPDGSIHPRRFLLGPSVSGSAGSAGFARPGFNGPGFRQNDRVARHLLDLLGLPSAPARAEAAAAPLPTQSRTAPVDPERLLSHAR